MTATRQFRVRTTLIFREWMAGLRDQRAVDRINQRVERLSRGLIGDLRSVGLGVSELRIDHGPGYRLYFTQRSGILIVLLCGGDKSSQRRDISLAHALAQDKDLDDGA
jgi:putative addiction module killer protein